MRKQVFVGVEGVEYAVARHQISLERDSTRAGQRRADGRYQRERRRSLEREQG